MEMRADYKPLVTLLCCITDDAVYRVKYGISSIKPRCRDTVSKSVRLRQHAAPCKVVGVTLPLPLLRSEYMPFLIGSPTVRWKIQVSAENRSDARPVRLLLAFTW